MLGSVPPEGPHGRVDQGGSDLADRGQRRAQVVRAFVADRVVLSSDGLGRSQVMRRAFDQELDVIEAEFQEPGAEPVFPGPQDGHERGARPGSGRSEFLATAKTGA